MCIEETPVVKRGLKLQIAQRGRYIYTYIEDYKKDFLLPLLAAKASESKLNAPAGASTNEGEQIKPDQGGLHCCSWMKSV